MGNGLFIWRQGMIKNAAQNVWVSFRVPEKFLGPYRHSQVAGRIKLIWHCWRLFTRMEQCVRVPDEFTPRGLRNWLAPIVLVHDARCPVSRTADTSPEVEQVMVIEGAGAWPHADTTSLWSPTINFVLWLAVTKWLAEGIGRDRDR